MAETGDPLSERELDVLRCLAQGATNKDIASDLTISENTVKVHLRNIYTKLGVSSRTEATTTALQQGYIVIPGQEESSAVEPLLSSDAAQSAAVPALATADGAEAPVPAITAEEAAPHSARRIVRLAIIGIGAVILLLAAFYLVQLLSTPDGSAEITGEPFAETAIENSNWMQSRPMPEARANMAVASVGLDLYQIGGETADGVDGMVHVFDSLERAWQPVAEKPTPVADVSAAELYGEIYVAGGRLPDGHPTAAVEAYSPTQDAWRPVAPLPHPVSGGLTLSDGAFLYLLGGHDGQVYLDTAYVFNPAEDSWRPLSPMPEPGAFRSGGVLTGKLIVVGGANESGDLASCYLFDPAEESWSECPEMLLPRKGAGAAVLLNKLYVIGGTAENEEITYSEMYDPDSETWQIINTPMLVEADGWPDPGIGQIETRIYALGGRDPEGFLDSTYVFAPLVYQTYIPAASSADGE
jgi:DNA-binding CsgD family transcriptional regulator/N-acetylneuraminic acid mutarotase